MAGSCKPDVPGLGKEASYVVNGYHFYASNYPQCPLFDGKTSGWNGGSDAIWFTDADYLDITVHSAFNIYKLSVVGWNDDQHQPPLTIWRFENGSWVNVTDRYPQKFNKAPTTWTKTMIDMPKGRYKFTQGKYRLDGEWYIEEAKSYGYLYETGNKIYGMSDEMFTKLSDNWSALTEEEKKSLFESTNYDTASVEDLATLGKFKVLNYSETNDKPELAVFAAPKDKLVLSRGFMRIEDIEGIDKATITKTLSGNGICKLLVTDDMKKYYAYDFDMKTWKVVDHTTLATVKTSGIDAAKFADIDRAAWDKLLKGKSGVGFAYLMAIEAVADQCAVDKLALQVDKKGKWA